MPAFLCHVTHAVVVFADNEAAARDLAPSVVDAASLATHLVHVEAVPLEEAKTMDDTEAPPQL